MASGRRCSQGSDPAWTGWGCRRRSTRGRRRSGRRSHRCARRDRARAQDHPRHGYEESPEVERRAVHDMDADHEPPETRSLQPSAGRVGISASTVSMCSPASSSWGSKPALRVFLEDRQGLDCLEALDLDHERLGLEGRARQAGVHTERDPKLDRAPDNPVSADEQRFACDLERRRVHELETGPPPISGSRVEAVSPPLDPDVVSHLRGLERRVPPARP